MATTAQPRIYGAARLSSKPKSSQKPSRSKDEIRFLDMAVDRLKSMSIEEYREASEKLEIIGNAAVLPVEYTQSLFSLRRTFHKPNRQNENLPGKEEMEMKKILISFIQDRSGSMSSVWEETLSGFKTYIADMQADQNKDSEVEYLFSLTTFDTQIETPYMGVPIAKVDGEKLKDYGPRAATALYDAVGKTLQAIDDDKSLTFDKAIVVIVTDGQENSSREWSKTALHAAIDERVKRGNWTFTYLGTQPETWSEASSLGVGVGASAMYNAANAGATYATMASASMKMARGVHASSRSFLHDNTSRSMRSAVGMSTQTDKDNDKVPVGVGASFGRTVPSTPQSPRSKTPITPEQPSTNRRWK